MEIFEILPGQLFQNGAPEEGTDWEPIHARGIDVVVDLYGTLDPGVDGHTAIEMVRQARPGALGNQTFVSYLEDLPAPKRPARA